MCRETERTHKHHIIPRYMGGSNSKENLVEVSITGHAMFHFCNYQLWGNEEDKIAWRMLSGLITVDEAKMEAMLLGIKRAKEVQKKLYQDEEYMEKYIQTCRKAFHNSPHKNERIKKLKEMQPIAIELAKTPEAIEKKKQTLKEIGHQQGEKNSQYGKMWITDGTKEGSYKINKGDPIPEGYREGRICGTEMNLKYSYTIISPYGETTTTFNLKSYCIENTLPYESMRRSCIRNKPYKGYIVHRTPIT